MTARSFKDPQLIKLACVELEYLASEHIGLVPESEFMWGPEDIDSWLGEVPSNMDDAYWDVVDEAYGDYFAPVGLYTELLEWVNLPEDLREPIKNRIIQLTDSFDGSNHFETGYVLAYRFPWPRIVGKLLEERGDYDRAINYYTGCEDKERCAYLRDGFIDQGLKQKLRELIEPRYHRQAEAYLIVFELELVLREIVQNTLSALPDVNSWWRSTIPKDIRDYAHEQMSKFSENPFLGNEGQTPRLIDFLTLPQLVQIVLEDRNWEEFRPYFREKRAFEGIMVILNAIRNDVAHARFLPEREFSRLKEFSQDILASIRRHSAKSREGG